MTDGQMMLIAKLCQDFSSQSTMNTAREELKSLYQEPGEPITIFIYKYGQMHYLLQVLGLTGRHIHSLLQGSSQL